MADALGMNRPIGYWIKELDHLLEATLDLALADVELTRRQWQVLNLVESRRSRDDIESDLLAFGTEDTTSAIEDLVSRRLVSIDAGGGTLLTAEGQDAVAAARGRVANQRQRMAAGITEDQYRETVQVLQRMVSNLQR